MNLTEQEARKVLRDTMSAVCEICHARYEVEDIDFLEGICSCCEAKDRVAKLVMMRCQNVGTRADLEASFEAFWTEYRKYKDANKKRAKTAWLRIKPDKDLVRRIMAALREQGQSEQWKRGYAPHAATWLNGEQWNDVIRDPKQPAGKRTGGNAGYAQRTFDEQDLNGVFLDIDSVVI